MSRARLPVFLATALIAACGGGGGGGMGKGGASGAGTGGSIGTGGGAGAGASGTSGSAGAGAGGTSGGAGAGSAGAGTSGTGGSAGTAAGGTVGTGGSAGTSGGAGKGGNAGTGGTPADCRTAGPCPALTYCDLADGQCKNGCADSNGCGANQTCDISSHACACATGFHDCGGVCSSNTSVASCGTSCTPCATPTDPNALAATCDSGGKCGIMCKTGYTLLGSCVSAGTYSTGPTIPTPRIYFAVVAGPDGRIYVIGGQPTASATPVAVVEAYTPSTNSWSTLKPMATARYGHWAVVVGTSASNFAIYAMGGDLAPGAGVTASVEKYDPAGNTWTAAPSMPKALVNLWATTATDAGGGTSIYTHGGMDSTGASGGNQYAFSPSSQQWTTPAAAQGMQTTATAAWVGINDTIYMPYGTTYAYKPATNTWSTLAGMMTKRDWPAAAVAKNGHLYIFGGDAGGHLSSAETYAPELDKWANIASMPTALIAPVAATGTDGRIYIFAAASATSGSLIFTP